jgi:hypothetical protein
MRYEFESAFGERIEIDIPVDEAPEIGSTRVVDGTTYKRVASLAQFVDSRNGSTKFPRFESHQLPRNWKHHKGEFGPTGKPRFANKAEVDEAVARARGDDTEIAYGEL